MNNHNRPPCRCKERRQAMVRAAAALALGDTETWKMESDFIRSTVVEDYKLYREWRSNHETPSAVRAPPTNEEMQRLRDETLTRILPSGVSVKK